MNIKAVMRDRFVDALAEAFRDRFDDVEIETYWNIFSSQLVTSRKDGAELDREQYGFVHGFSTAWIAATAIVAEREDA